MIDFCELAEKSTKVLSKIQEWWNEINSLNYLIWRIEDELHISLLILENYLDNREISRLNELREILSDVEDSIRFYSFNLRCLSDQSLLRALSYILFYLERQEEEWIRLYYAYEVI